MILVLDAGLNYYFVRAVRYRLVKFHGLTKYKPLIKFNVSLMVISVGLDVGSPATMHT